MDRLETFFSENCIFNDTTLLNMGLHLIFTPRVKLQGLHRLFGKAYFKILITMSSLVNLKMAAARVAT